MKLSNQPYKGTTDWFPEEFKIRKYIFDTWRAVCENFGYEEYLTPLVESADIYRAKSGEDIGGKELAIINDKGGRELAIRPEMTPSVTRMITRIYDQWPKPIRFFSIANFMRMEKPQRGRNREFWQLNFDIFGTDSINADIEILQMALEIMLAFNPPKASFTMFINNRKLIDFIITDICKVIDSKRLQVVRSMDKFEKLEENEFKKLMRGQELEDSQIENIIKFLKSTSEEELKANFPEVVERDGFKEITQIKRTLEGLGYGEWIKFQPNVIRGFDYYDGLVFEVFDNNPSNNRSMFGGGRYNGLAGIFGSNSFPAVGCAPGDETTRLFLESWNLLDQIKKSSSGNRVFIPVIGQGLEEDVLELAQRLRNEGKLVEVGLEPEKVGKALNYADKKEFDYVVLFGEEEKGRAVYKLKDMKSGQEEEVKL